MCHTTTRLSLPYNISDITEQFGINLLLYGGLVSDLAKLIKHLLLKESGWCSCNLEVHMNLLLASKGQFCIKGKRK